MIARKNIRETTAITTYAIDKAPQKKSGEEFSRRCSSINIVSIATLRVRAPRKLSYFLSHLPHPWRET
jgi:hypothetical protein